MPNHSSDRSVFPKSEKLNLPFTHSLFVGVFYLEAFQQEDGSQHREQAEPEHADDGDPDGRWRYDDRQRAFVHGYG